MSKSTISTFELFQMFPDQESARVYFEARRGPDGATCPACGEAMRIGTRKGGFYRCNACLLDFTIRTGTIFERSKVPLHKWLYAMYLLVTARKGISSVQLHAQIGVTQKTAWFMLQRLREACGNDPTELAGIVEREEPHAAPARPHVRRRDRPEAHLQGTDRMSDAIRAILDAVTDRVFAYRPKDKGEWAKRTERKVKRQRKNAEKADD